VILKVDRFLLLRRERGAPGHTDDQQDCEQELFHVNLHFDSWEQPSALLNRTVSTMRDWA